jgi:hypothetical protein
MTLEEAIAATLPTGLGQRNQKLFLFARYLKGMPRYCDLKPSQLGSELRQWHKRALPFIGTKRLSVTERDFANAWKCVKVPIAERPLARIVRRALNEPAPEECNRYDNPDLKKLISVCFKLQQYQGDSPFFLTCRDAARVIGGSAAQKNKWNGYFRQLCADGILRLHQPGCLHRASEYFYVGGQA